jgi:hypothetical protein
MARLAIARSGGSAGGTSRATASSAFDRAIEHFAQGRWSEAFEQLVPLADAGDREAARIATLMTTRGPRLFGRSFPASPLQRKHWHLVASRAYTTKTMRE